jgi:hypothetical protein
MTEQKYHCADCNKELEISFVRLQMMIDESYKLKKQNNKLLEFVKRVSQEDPPIEFEKYFQKHMWELLA